MRRTMTEGGGVTPQRIERHVGLLEREARRHLYVGTGRGELCATVDIGRMSFV